MVLNQVRRGCRLGVGTHVQPLKFQNSMQRKQNVQKSGPWAHCKGKKHLGSVTTMERTRASTAGSRNHGASFLHTTAWSEHRPFSRLTFLVAMSLWVRNKGWTRTHSLWRSQWVSSGDASTSFVYGLCQHCLTDRHVLSVRVFERDPGAVLLFRLQCELLDSYLN